MASVSVPPALSSALSGNAASSLGDVASPASVASGSLKAPSAASMSPRAASLTSPRSARTAVRTRSPLASRRASPIPLTYDSGDDNANAEALDSAPLSSEGSATSAAAFGILPVPVSQASQTSQSSGLAAATPGGESALLAPTSYDEGELLPSYASPSSEGLVEVDELASPSRRASLSEAVASEEASQQKSIEDYLRSMDYIPHPTGSMIVTPSSVPGQPSRLRYVKAYDLYGNTVYIDVDTPTESESIGQYDLTHTEVVPTRPLFHPKDGVLEHATPIQLNVEGLAYECTGGVCVVKRDAPTLDIHETHYLSGAAGESAAARPRDPSPVRSRRHSRSSSSTSSTSIAVEGHKEYHVGPVSVGGSKGGSLTVTHKTQSIALEEGNIHPYPIVRLSDIVVNAAAVRRNTDASCVGITARLLFEEKTKLMLLRSKVHSLHAKAIRALEAVDTARTLVMDKSKNLRGVMAKVASNVGQHESFKAKYLELLGDQCKCNKLSEDLSRRARRLMALQEVFDHHESELTAFYDEVADIYL